MSEAVGVRVEPLHWAFSPLVAGASNLRSLIQGPLRVKSRPAVSKARSGRALSGTSEPKRGLAITPETLQAAMVNDRRFTVALQSGRARALAGRAGAAALRDSATRASEQLTNPWLVSSARQQQPPC